MKDLLPAFTFSFLMAQLFPGAVTVLVVTSAYVAISAGGAANSGETLPSLFSLYASVGDLWFGTTRNVVIFLFLSAATGMFLHGLSWMILGWETQGRNEHGELAEDQYIMLRELSFHSQTLWKQMLLAPLQMVREILDLLRSPALKWITIDENVSETDPKSLPVFTWLQDFYLYFGQFYVHMSYALLIGFGCTILALIRMGLTSRRIIFVVSLYVLTSLFFLMGRTQLATLFKNEATLKATSDGSGVPHRSDRTPTAGRLIVEAHRSGIYFSSSFLPAFKLSKFRIALNTRK